jgi:hypothetical protein
MWKCPRCGETNQDQYDTCWECERNKSQPLDINAPPYRPSPFYGIVSFCSPLGILLVIATIPRPGIDNWGYEGAVLLILGGALSILVGLISALVAIFREERHIYLALIGLLMNTFILMYFATYDYRHHHH